MTEVVREGGRVLPVIRQLKATGVAQRVSISLVSRSPTGDAEL